MFSTMRNTKEKDNKAHVVDENIKNGNLKTRRRSSHIDAASTDKRILKNVQYNKKKLNTQDIINDLESSGDEFEVIAKPAGMTGKLRSTRSKSNAKEPQSKRHSIHRTNVNYNINYSFDEYEGNLKKRRSESVRKKQIENSVDVNVEDVKINNRKRSVATNKNQILENSYRVVENEADENTLTIANSNSPPKRLRIKNPDTSSQLETSQLRTPSKNGVKSCEKLVSTPTSSLSKLRITTKCSSRSSKNKRTKSIEDLKMNETSGPITRRRTINTVKDNLFAKNNSSLNKSTCKLLRNDFKKIGKTRASMESVKLKTLCDSESEDNDDSDSYELSSIYSDSDSDSNEDSDYIKQPVVSKRKSLNNLRKSSTTLTRTPNSALEKSIKKLSLKDSFSPSMRQRTNNISKPSTPLQEVRLKLHVNVIPKSLPCREEQFNEIYSYLHTRLSDSSGGCIYISGVPGTGKTATVNEVIRCLNKSMKYGKIPKFKFVDINGMKLSEPRQAYVQIWKQLTGETLTWEAAQKSLHNEFTKSKSKLETTLLLVDELDLLCTKRQDVVYNILDWPSKANAKLVVVTIANTMDLPERILLGKITSRLGLTRLTFPPYNHKQLEEIVMCRLQGYNAFGGETIQLIARKVAAVSGDARRALDICRRATEVAEINGQEMVTMADVKKALDEMIARPKIQAIKYCSDMEKCFLKAVCAEVHRTGVEEVSFDHVYFQLQTLCTFDGEKAPNITESLAICARLSSWRLLLCDHSKMDIHQRLLLNVTTDDVNFALGH